MKPHLKLGLILVVFLALNWETEATAAFRDLGVPIRAAMCWGAYLGPGKTGTWDTLYLSFGQHEASLFLLAVNPDTGEMRQFNGPLSSEVGSWGLAVDHENRIYLGSYYNAHLLRFDPKRETWDDLGKPGGEKESFICRITTAPDGKIWGGTYPSANLFYYDPKTGTSRNFGRMDPDQFYCYPTAGADGLVYCAIQFQKIDIVVFDPKTETKVSLLSAEDRGPGRVTLLKGSDGKMYAELVVQNQWFSLEKGKRVIKVSGSEIPFPKSGLPDGREFVVVDHRVLRLENPRTKETREIPLRYEASGACIFTLATGPDGRIYGSSMLPLRLFSYDLENRAFVNIGKASFADGEIYSMGSLAGKFYLGSYPGARLSVYDPKKGIQFGDKIDSNPRDLGPLGEQQDRPRAMVAGPHGRIYIGTYPDYGHHGGAISVYDPEKNEKRVFRHVVPNQSIASLAYIESSNLFAAGSSVRGGSGTRKIEKEAKLILWNPNEERTVFAITPVTGAGTILSLAGTTDGMLYGITDNEKVFCFDPKKKEVRKVLDLKIEKPREVSLQRGPDGMLYGLAKETIFSIDPRDARVSILARSPVEIDSGMAILGRKIYFGSGAHLWEFEIPSASSKPTD